MGTQNKPTDQNKKTAQNQSGSEKPGNQNQARGQQQESYKATDKKPAQGSNQKPQR